MLLKSGVSAVFAVVVPPALEVCPASSADDFSQTWPDLSLQCVAAVMFGRLSSERGDTDCDWADVREVAPSNKAIAYLNMGIPPRMSYGETRDRTEEFLDIVGCCPLSGEKQTSERPMRRRA